MHRIPALSLLAVLAVLVAPGTASAGTYHVYTCAVGGTTYPNAAWTTATAAGVAIDNSCAGSSIALSVAAAAAGTNNTAAGLTFTSPSGTTIANFSLTRALTYNNPVKANTHRFYATYTLGSTVFAGAGNYADATRNALNAQKLWYGYPEANATLAKGTVTKANFASLDSYTGNANTLALHVGCFNRGTPCSVDTGGAISDVLFGADVTVNDPTLPAVTVDSSGLLSGPYVNGSDPVTVTATDNSGIRSVQLIDITNPAAPLVVGGQDYATTPTNAKKVCAYSQPAPCPNLSRQVITPESLPAGQRTLIVRVTDAGGNVVDRGPYSFYAVTPSDRGALNGVNATDTATLYVQYTSTKAPHRTVGYDAHVGVRGKLINAAGQPIGNAKLTLLTRDLRENALVVPRATLTTRADGSFNTTVAASASRLLQFTWLSHANDVRAGANGYLTLRAKASGHLSASTRHPRVGHAMTVSGKLRGVSRGGVTVIVQGRQAGSRRYETFDDATTSSSGAFKVHYTFRSPASRGKAFVFRARIRPAARFPYEAGYSDTVTVRVR